MAEWIIYLTIGMVCGSPLIFFFIWDDVLYICSFAGIVIIQEYLLHVGLQKAKPQGCGEISLEKRHFSKSNIIEIYYHCRLSVRGCNILKN